MIHRRTLIGTAVVAGLATATRAAPVTPKGEDWPDLGRYTADNQRIILRGEPIGVVFLGDSITEGWSSKRPGFFTAGRINRGIGGQTSPQMLLRVMADVVALRPRALHLMAGTNDIAGNTGPMTTTQTQDNLRAIVQLARANGIAVLLASVPPAAHFPWRPGLATVTPIGAINHWAAGAATALGATFVDYTPSLADARGAMRPGFAYDGVHPTAAGYDAMAAVLSPFLAHLAV